MSFDISFAKFALSKLPGSPGPAKSESVLSPK